MNHYFFQDYLGDMDFKLAVGRSGVTALQADVKLPGVGPEEVVREAVERGVGANHRILDIMERCIAGPREKGGKECWPVTRRLTVSRQKRAKFLGPAGLNLRRVTAETGVQVNAVEGEEDGACLLYTSDAADE